MDVDQILSAADQLLEPFSIGATRFEGRRLDVVMTPDHLVPAVKALLDSRWGYLATITGLDHPWPKTPPKGPTAPTPEFPADGPLEDRLEALYHFVSGPVIATLRVSVPYSHARVPSICHLVPTATLYERELQEMFGIVVENTPVTDRLLLPDDWPEGVYPLRKSFTGLQAAAKA
jgi:NADH:ubiquinone oxidoreductase subunit C